MPLNTKPLNHMPGHLIRRLHQISTQTFQQHMQEAGFDITPVQFATMETLHTNPGLEQAQIASLIAYDRATIGGVIDRLEQRNYVIRETSIRDRRAREVRLSDLGEQVYLKASPIVTALQSDILGNLNKTEQKQLVVLLTKAVSRDN